MSDAEQRTWEDRLLALPGEDADDAREDKFTAMRRLLLVAVAAESWEAALHHWIDRPGFALHVAMAVGLTLLAVAGWPSRWAREATLAAAAIQVLEVGLALPLSANHHFFFALLLLVAGTLGGDREGRGLALSFVRWIVALGLCWAGIQKLLYGYYFRGEFLAYAVSQDARFADFFSLFLPAADIARLQALQVGDGAGPFRFDSPLFVAMSNLAWVPEVLLPPLLLSRHARPWAAAGLAAYVVGIELGARELYLGLPMLFTLSLYARGRLATRLFPLFLIAYLYLLSMSWGLLPHWYFT